MKTFNPRGPFLYYDKQYQQRWLSVPKIEKKEEQSFFKLEQFPRGFLSALVIVDHCDFDSLKKVEAVFYGTSDKNSKDYGKKGIVGTGLTMTKTVFASGEGSENIGLENKEYLKIINELYNKGIEIAAHSLHPKKSLSKDDKLVEKYLRIMEKFKASTWVDHGYLGHNFTRFGWNKESKYYLLDILFKKRYRFFWSGIDYSLNAPDGNLNLFDRSGRAGRVYLWKILRLFKEKKEFSKITFAFFWDFIGNLIGRQAKDDLFFCFGPENCRSPVRRTLKRVINPIFYYNIFKNYFIPDKYHSLTEGVFPIFIGDNNDSILSFTSIWVNDFENCYSPKNIDRLIEGQGLHIGHNYLAVEEKHYLGLAFKKQKDEYYISDKFQNNLNYMAKKQKENLLWVTNMRSYGDYYLSLKKVKMTTLSGKSVLLENTGDDRIRGITISHPITEKGRGQKILLNKLPLKMKKICKDRLFFWFDLSPKEELILEVI